MQLFVFAVLLLLTLTESSSVESNKLSSIDIIAFKYSLDASQHYDCPRVGDRAAKAEEARIWQTVIPDARIEEAVVSSESRALRTAEQYKWVSSDPLMQSSALLGMRKPNFYGSTALVRVLYSKSKQISQDALSAMLSQLEQSKDKILEWMARTQVPIASMAPRITDPLVDQRFEVPQATNYHPRVFGTAQFTTGDLVAWIALAAASRQKDQDAFKVFKLMAQSFLPGFSVSLETVPTSSSGMPTKTVFLHRSFQYVPAGADLAFYFDGNRGKFLKTQNDSIVLNEGIVDGQQHAALLLSSSLNVDASSLEIHQSKTDIAMRKTFCGQLENALALDTCSGATGAEAVGVSTIRSRAAHLQRDSFLEAQRKAPESKPTLLTELLSDKLVKLVIDYFSDGSYHFIVSTHKWSFKDEPQIIVDGARLYVITNLEGLRGLDHSLANLKEDKRRCREFGNPQWSDYMHFTSSHDGLCVSFNYKYMMVTNRKKQTKYSTKWLMQSNKLEDDGFKRVAFDGEKCTEGFLSRDGRTFFSYSKKTNVTRVYRVREEAGKNFTAIMKLKLDGFTRTASDDGNRVMVENADQLKIYDIDKDASKLVYQINEASRYIRDCILNETGSEVAFVKGDKLQIIKVDEIVKDKADQSAIVSVKIAKSSGKICQLAYDDRSRLHVLHKGGKVFLFDPLKKALVSIETLYNGQEIISCDVSPNADYIAMLQRVGEEEESGKTIYRSIVKRKLTEADWSDLFGCEADKTTSNSKQTESSSDED